MKVSHIVLLVLLCVGASFLTASYVAQKDGAAGMPARQSAYDRVLKTGVLRCGYAEWPPYVFTKDISTGKVAGIMPDVLEAMADKLGIKIEWTEGTGWGSLIESLQSHRIDAFCAGAWRNAERGRSLAFTTPVFYSAVYPYVAEGDHRFDKALAAVNSPDIHISAMDGEVSDVIAREYFPKAQKVSIPQLAAPTDMLINVATHKADIVFNEPGFADDFIKANPGKIRRAQDIPFQVFPTPFAVDIHEAQLRDMLDSALDELRNLGVVDRIISKYSDDPKVFLRVAAPYAMTMPSH